MRRLSGGTELGPRRARDLGRAAASTVAAACLIGAAGAALHGVPRGAAQGPPLGSERTIDLAATPETEILGAPDKDQLGSDLRTGDVNGDGTPDLVAGAQFGSESGRNIVGRGYSLFGRDAWPARLDLATGGTADWSFFGRGREARMGASAATGDVSGDGVDDLLLGSVLADPFDQVNGGAVYVMFGGESAGGHVDFLEDDPDALFAGDSDTFGSDQIGTDLVTGDFNGDHQADVAIAAAMRDDFTGAVFIYWGPFAGGEVHNLRVGEADWTLVGPEARAFFGANILAADVNGDGVDDVVASSLVSGLGGEPPGGAVFVFTGHPDRGGTDPALNADTTLVGAPGTGIGTAFSAGACSCRGRPLVFADVTGDGIADMAVGSPTADDRSGRVLVVPGPLSPGVRVLDDDTIFTLRGAPGTGRLGWTVAVGHLDGDDDLDVVVAAPWANVADRATAGHVYGLRGPLPSRGVLTMTAGTAPLGVLGPDPASGTAGTTVVLTDTDGDGADDLHLGYPDAAPDGRRSVGGVYRLGGPLLATRPSATPSPSPGPGTTTATATTPPTATATATSPTPPTPTGTITATITPTRELTATQSPTPSASPTHTPTTTATTPVPTPTPTDDTSRALYMPSLLQPLRR